MEEQGLAASTIDRRLSTVCGFYRFAHIDGRIRSNPAQSSAGPGYTHLTPGVSTAPSSACSCSPPSSTTATMRRGCAARAQRPAVSEACATNIEDLGLERGHRTCVSSARATSPRPSRSFLVQHGPSTSPSASAARGRSCGGETGSASSGGLPTGGSVRSVGGLAWARCIPTCSGLRSSWRRSRRGFRFVTSSSPPGTPTHAQPPSRPPTAEPTARRRRRRGLRRWRIVLDTSLERHLRDTTSVTPARSRTSANRCRSVAVGPRRPVHGSHREPPRGRT